jgi:hypothetical protein
MVRVSQTESQRALRRGERRFSNTRSTMRVNGSMLVAGGVALSIVSVGPSIEEHGPVLGVLVASLVFAVMFVPGVLMLRHSGRMRRPAWLENLRFRDSGIAADSGDVRNPPSADQSPPGV